MICWHSPSLYDSSAAIFRWSACYEVPTEWSLAWFCRGSEILNDEGDIRNHWKKFSTIGNVLIRKFGSFSDHAKRILFRVHCFAIYRGSLWTNFSVTGLCKPKVCHNDILRGLLGVPSRTNALETFARAVLDNKEVRVRKISFSSSTRVVNSQNLILDAIYSSHGFKQSRLYSRWISIMSICLWM